MKKHKLNQWLKDRCPNFFKHTHLSETDCKIITDLVHNRNFKLPEFFMLMEKIISGEFEFNFDSVEIFSRAISSDAIEKLLNIDDEPVELVSVVDAAEMLGLHVEEFGKKYNKKRSMLQAVPMPCDGALAQFCYVKKHVELAKELGAIWNS